MTGRGQTGQSTVEVVALLPLLLGVAFAAFAFLSAGAAKEAAAAAAQAGAMAMLQDADPEDAAERTLDAGDAGAARIQVSGRRVTVTVRPRVAGPAGRFLTATASAEAGSGVPAASTSTTTVRGGDGESARR